MTNCESCESPLTQRPDEKPYLFAKRRFCNNSCSKASGPLPDRFWSYVQKTERCWLWIGKTDDAGYGLIKIGGRAGKWMRAHRIAFLLEHGYIPVNVLHRCDTPGCVRVDHLFGGSIADNVADMILKGRAAWQKRLTVAVQ